MQKRNLSIDYIKALLVFGMVLSHSIQLVKSTEVNVANRVINTFSTYINLITFSGFFFCFGFVYYLAYFKKEFKLVKGNILNNAGKTLLAYYISAIAFRFFYSDDFQFTGNNFLKIILLLDIPKLSEFLLSFFFVTIISFVFFNTIKKLIEGKGFYIVFIISLLSSVFVPADIITNNYVGLFIGTKNFLGFPILQYLVYFLAGIYFAKNKVTFSKGLFLASILSTFSFIIYFIIYKSFPVRFPPSIFWILGAAGVLYFYYLFCLWLNNRFNSLNFLLLIGNNTLFYLLMSNLILLATFKKFQPMINGNGILAFAYGFMTLAIIYFLTGIIRRGKKN